MSLISYAQNFEDVMLWRALKHVKEGFYIDVGAQHPIIDSVSLAFYEHGWRGIHVEPSAYYAPLLRENRPDEKVIEAAVGKKRGTLKFFEIPETGLSTGDPCIAERHRALGHVIHEKDVPCVTLADIFETHVDQQIHWLKIDVEGLENDALQGWCPSKARPWVVVVESTHPLTQVEAYKEWEKLILDLDYEFVFFDGLNRYYLSTRHLELKGAFQASPNVFDDFVLTAGSPFCSLLNKRHAARELELVAKIQQAEAKAQQAEAKAQQAEAKAQQAETMAQQAEARATEAEAKVQQATTWFFRKGLKPTRTDVVEAYRYLLGREPENESVILGHMRKKTVGKLISSFMSSEEYRLRMNSTAPFQSGAGFAQNHPALKAKIKKWIQQIPALEKRRGKMALNRSLITRQIKETACLRPISEDLSDLTPRARQIYADLKTTIARLQKENG